MTKLYSDRMVKHLVGLVIVVFGLIGCKDTLANMSIMNSDGTGSIVVESQGYYVSDKAPTLIMNSDGTGSIIFNN